MENEHPIIDKRPGINVRVIDVMHHISPITGEPYTFFTNSGKSFGAVYCVPVDDPKAEVMFRYLWDTNAEPGDVLHLPECYSPFTNRWDLGWGVYPLNSRRFNSVQLIN